MSKICFNIDEMYSDLNPKLYLHKDRIIHNLKYVKSKNLNSTIYAILKGNAYGMGIANVGEILKDLVHGFGVARLVEGFILRETVPPELPILILSGVHTEEALQQCFHNNFFPIIGNQYQMDSYIKMAGKNKSRQQRKMFLKIDSGMHRFGFALSQIDRTITHIKKNKIEDICLTLHPHLALHKEFSTDTLRQLNLIETIAKRHNCTFSAANSPASLFYNEYNLGSIIRVGTALYGYEIEDKNLQPAFSSVAYVINIVKVLAGKSVGYARTWQAKRDSKIMILNIGYADGLVHSANKGYILLNKKKCPIIGLTMDVMFVDITDIPDKIKLHQEIELFGDSLAIQEFADAINCSVDQLITQLSAFRVRREIV